MQRKYVNKSTGEIQWRDEEPPTMAPPAPPPITDSMHAAPTPYAGGLSYDEGAGYEGERFAYKAAEIAANPTQPVVDFSPLKLQSADIAQNLPEGTPQVIPDVLAGTQRAAINLAAGFTSPLGIMTFGGGTMGSKAAELGLDALFGAQMVSGLPEEARQTAEAFNKKDWGTFAEKGLGALGTSAFLGQMVKGVAAKTEPTIKTAPGDTATKLDGSPITEPDWHYEPSVSEPPPRQLTTEEYPGGGEAPALTTQPSTTEAVQPVQQVAEKQNADQQTIIQEGQSKPLTGTEGDTKQSSLFGQREELFQGETAEQRSGQSQLAIIPYLKEFIQQDVVPVLGKGVAAVKSGIDIIRNTLAPTTKIASANLDALFSSRGNKERIIFQVGQMVDKIERAWSKVPESDQIAFIDRIKRGEPQPTPELQQAADLFRQLDESTFKQWQRVDPDATHLENHLRVFWKELPFSGKETKLPSGVVTRRPFAGTRGFRRQHVLPDISTGIANGGVPVSTNPFTLLKLATQDVMKFVSAQDAFTKLKDSGGIQFVKTGGDIPVGYTRVNDNFFQRYFPTDKGLVKAGEWYVEEGTARALNNYLSKNHIRDNDFGNALANLKNTLTGVELIGPFHAVFETLESASSTGGLLTAKAASPSTWGSGWRQAALPPARVGKYALQQSLYGSDLAKVDPESAAWLQKHFPNAEQLVQEGWEAGLGGKMHQDFQTRYRDGFNKAIANNNAIGAAVRAIPGGIESVQRYLFDIYIPRLKWGSFLKEYSFRLQQQAGDLAKGTTTRSEIARDTRQFVEDRFGELNWDNLYWNNTFKSVMQLAFRSTTWKAGTLHGFYSGIRDVGLEATAPFREGRAPRMTLPMAWTMNLALVTGITASLVSKAATGKYPWQFAGSDDPKETIKNLTYPIVDETTQARVAVPTYLRDLVSLFHSPSQYLGHSLSGLFGHMRESWQNKNFYGEQIASEDDPTWKQWMDKIGHSLYTEPIMVSSFRQSRNLNEPAWKSALAFGGFTKAPAHITQSEALQKGYEYLHAEAPSEGMSHEQFDRSQTIRDLAASWRQGYGEGYRKTADAIRAGKIQPTDVNRIKLKARLTPLQYVVHQMNDVQRTVKVYGLATPEEKKQIRPYVLNKIGNSGKPFSEKIALRKKVLEK